MHKELKLPCDLSSGYFDSSIFGAIKVTPKRICTMFEIEYFLEDGNNIFLNGESYRVRKNRVHICSPGDERNSELPFKTKYVKFSAEGVLADMLRAAPKYFKIFRSYEVICLLDEIIMLDASKEKNYLLLQGKLLTFISLVLEEANDSQMASSYKRGIVMQSQSFIKEHFGQQIKLSDIAKEVNLSPNYYHTLFAESCGVTPHDYLVECRVNAAKNLLITTDLMLSDIAERCGFKTQQYLASTFKAKVGCSPAYFRQQHRNAYFG